MQAGLESKEKAGDTRCLWEHFVFFWQRQPAAFQKYNSDDSAASESKREELQAGVRLKR